MSTLTLPETTERRFEAVVLMGDAAHRAAKTALRIQQAVEAGLVVAVVGAAPVDEIAYRVGAGGLPLGSLVIVGCDRDAITVLVDGERTVLPRGDEADVLTVVLTQLWQRGLHGADVLVGVLADGMGGAGAAGDDDVRTVVLDLTGVDALLDDQLRRRRQRELPDVDPEPAWRLDCIGLDPHRERVCEALFGLADGRSGTSGAPLADHDSTYPWVLVSGVYAGEGAETSLLTAPVGTRLPFRLTDTAGVRRVLDLRTGVLHEHVECDEGPITSARFASLARPGTVVVRARCPAGGAKGELLASPADHVALDGGTGAGTAWMRVTGGTGGVAAAAVQDSTGTAAGDLVDRVVVYDGDPNVVPDLAVAQRRAQEAGAAGFDRLVAEQRAAWARRWEDADIIIEGDDELQQAVRFTLFQLMASVADIGEVAVGARGISGPSYRGHVFWDADTFVLPFFAATHPASARAMLEYRIRRLPAALAAAREAGRDGARFPWESARSGRDVTPTSARDRTGRIVPIRTGLLEEHIVADVAWAACCYVDWTGDREFAAGPLVDILIQTARYWTSRIRLDQNGEGHIYGVIGPDEYHEPVDDNAFTNVLARWNLRRASAVAAAGSTGGTTVTQAEVDRWLRLASALVDGYDPDTGIYEQFAGFNRLEPLIIEEVAPRRPIAADLLLGADRVRESQVIKQADVLMLHHLVPDDVVPETLEPNLRYYEPRTAHGSSLSPAVHASLLARARDFDKALPALRIAARIDLDDLTASTAGGLHLATMGGVWQALAYGFAGLRPRQNRLEIDPRLPPTWGSLEVRVQYRGAPVRVSVVHDALSVVSGQPVAVTIGGAPYTVGPDGLELRRRGPTWEEMS